MTGTKRQHAKLPEGSVWTGPELLFDGGISGTDLKVFLGLCSYANVDTDSTFVGQDTLSHRLNMSKKTIVTSLKKLEELGYIESETRCKTAGKGRTTNVYKIINQYPPEEEEQEELVEVAPAEAVQPKQPPTGSTQKTLFDVPGASSDPYDKLDKMREGKDKSVLRIDGALGGHIPYESLSLLDVCYYYQHMHKEIVGYSVSVNKTSTQAQGRKTSMDYMEQFMSRFNLTVQTVIQVIPRLLAEFKALCESQGRKKSEWTLHIGVLTWTGSNADVEKIMQRVQPKFNPKFAEPDEVQPQQTPKNQSSGIVF